MNKLCKQYLSDAKKFFPIMGRKERDYLRKVRCDIEDFIEAENITSKSELIEKYRQPYEVANNYYSTFFDTDLIIKRIKVSKYLKALISVIIILVLIGATIFVFFWNNNQQMALREEMVGSKQVTAISNNKNEHNVNKGKNYDSMIKNNDEEIIEEEEIIE